MLQCSTSPLELPHLKGWTVTSGASLVAQRLKCLPPMLETQFRSLGQEDPLEKEMVTHSSILAWRIPWTEKPGRLSPWGRKESDTTERLHLLTYSHIWLLVFIGDCSSVLSGLCFFFLIFPFILLKLFNQILYFSYRTHPKYITLYLTCAVLSHFSRVRLFVIPWTVCSLPGSSVHGILQARIQEWVAMPSLYLTWIEYLPIKPPTIWIISRIFSSAWPLLPKWALSLTVQQKRCEHKYLATVLYQKCDIQQCSLVVTTSGRMVCYTDSIYSNNKCQTTI